MVKSPNPACPHCSSEKTKIHDSGNRLRHKCNNCTRTFGQTAAASTQHAEVKAVRGKRFVVTSAVSSSPVHKGFLATLERYCADNSAKLMIIPLPYNNPSASNKAPKDADGKKKKARDVFAPEVIPYLQQTRVELGHKLQVLADVPVQPTASRPLTGLESFGGEKSAILGHPKVAFKTVPTRIGKLPKVVLSTGACTLPRYSASKAGKKGEFHHVLAAAVVELTATAFHVRHVHANKDGSFFDLDKKWSAKGATESTISVLTLGDLHAARVDHDAFAAIQAMIKAMKPKTLVLHDVLDFESASHHNNYFSKVALHAQGRTNVEHELRVTTQRTDALVSLVKEAIMVPSNHHDHYLQWLLRQNDNVENEEIYLDARLAGVRAAKAGKHFDPFKYSFEQMTEFKSRYLWLDGDTACVRQGIEYGVHGHKGPGGVRGSRASFLGMGSKLVIGHSHSPGIDDGVYQVGTSSQYRMGYNKGLGSWLHTHAITYPNGKRTLITSIKQEWRA